MCGFAIASNMLAWSFVLVLFQQLFQVLVYGETATTPATPGCTPPAVSPPSASPTPTTAVATVDTSLTIFYDAMEASSQKFFNSVLINQLFLCTALSSRVNVTFIPCQKAQFKNGALSCTSPADPTCTLNKVHACAIAQIADKTQLANYLACTMKSANALPNFAMCATTARVNDCEIQKCANSDEGKNLCKTYSEKVMEDMNTLPGFLFKSPENIKPTDLFEYLDYFRNDLCVNQLQTTICAQLKSTKAVSLPQECNKKLVVGIFYKAMDEGSQKWFRAMVPIYEKFADYIVLKYQPCMFAEMSPAGVLDCQDANDPECKVGIRHACAASLLRDSPAALFKFLSCTAKDSKTMPDFQKCATDSGIIYDDIKSCATSEIGKVLCHFSSKTRPRTTQIPSFSYELAFDEATSKKTSEATDLSVILCEQLKTYGIIRPSVCGP